MFRYQLLLGFDGFTHAAPRRYTPMELVRCEDTGNDIPYWQTHETSDGRFFENETAIDDCPICGDCVSAEEIEDNGHCNHCEESLVRCDCCMDRVFDTRYVNGDDICNDCIENYYTTCDNCCDTVAIDDTQHGYCNNCQSEEFEPDYSWECSGPYARMGTSRRFGIELETSDSPRYNEWARNYGWGVKEDGSTSGMEYVSPPLSRDEGLDNVLAVCKILQREGCEIDRACGYHCHIDLSDTDEAQRKAIGLAYHYTCEFWHSLVEAHRRGTYYAAKHTYGRDEILCDETPMHRIYDDNGRYVWINWQSFPKHKTVEIRLHHATIDGPEVINWARAHAMFIDYVMGLSAGQITRVFGDKSVGQIASELKHIWQDDELASYYFDKMNSCAV